MVSIVDCWVLGTSAIVCVEANCCRYPQRAIDTEGSGSVGDNAAAFKLYKEGQIACGERRILRCHRDVSTIGIACIGGK
jgi:hypothetical protein